MKKKTVRGLKYFFVCALAISVILNRAAFLTALADEDVEEPGVAAEVDTVTDAVEEIPAAGGAPEVGEISEVVKEPEAEEPSGAEEGFTDDGTPGAEEGFTDDGTPDAVEGSDVEEENEDSEVDEKTIVDTLDITDTENEVMTVAYVYTDMGNGTHAVGPNAIVARWYEAHTFVGGVCVCGALEPYSEPEPSIDHSQCERTHAVDQGNGEHLWMCEHGAGGREGHTYVDGVCSKCEAKDPEFKPEDGSDDDKNTDSDYSYIDRGDGMHNVVSHNQGVDRVVRKEAHTYVDGVCSKCGALEPDSEPSIDHSQCERTHAVDQGNGEHLWMCEHGAGGREAHTYVNGKCVCGAQEPQISDECDISYTDQHNGELHLWYCKTHKEGGREAHTYVDGECSKCGAKEPEKSVCEERGYHWFDNYENLGKEGHRHTCPDCGLTEQEEHSFLKDENRCDICGYEKPNESVCEERGYHWFDDYENLGEEGHEHTCPDCGLTEQEEHSFLKDENRCDICGYEKSNESDDNLQPPIEDDGDDDADTDADADTDTDADADADADIDADADAGAGSDDNNDADVNDNNTTGTPADIIVAAVAPIVDATVVIYDEIVALAAAPADDDTVIVDDGIVALAAAPEEEAEEEDTVIIEDEVTPLAAVPAGGSDDGDGGIMTIGDEATPLAAGVEEVACCVMHLILLCAALAVEIFYFHDRKKRQEEEYDLRLELGR